MFHGKHFESRLNAVSRLVGVDLTADQVSLLGAFTDWLASEGAEAGGIGPVEAGRLEDRHIADSLIYAAAWGKNPSTLLDVGSGVGLPGIPLAIAYPQIGVTLVDRSGRRCSLARRVVRVLGLQNVVVRQEDVGNLTGSWDVVVFRASLPPADALKVAPSLLAAGGRAVVGLSRKAAPEFVPTAPSGTSVVVTKIGEGVLDSPAWLLRMTLMNTPPTNDSSI